MPLFRLAAVAALLLAHAAPAFAVTADPEELTQWSHAAMQLMEMRELPTAGTVVVAVIDSGIDAAHPELASRLWTNPGEIAGNGLDDDANGYVDDLHGWNVAENSSDLSDQLGHGSAVAGVIAAARDGAGIEGVAPEARIMAVKVVRPGEPVQLKDLASAIRYAVRNGADVINMSITVDVVTEELRIAVKEAFRAGVLVVVCAGNADVPADLTFGELPGVLRVGAVAANDTVATFSQAGPDLVAPGVTVRTVDAVRGGTTSYDGTSFAAANASGVIALLLSTRPDVRAPDMERLLVMTARDLGPTGPDPASGAGALDAAAAARALESLPITLPELPLPTVLAPVPVPDTYSTFRETFIARLLARLHAL